MKNSLPNDLKKLFTLKVNIHNYDTRQVFHLPSICTSSYGINSIKFLCPSMWNTLFKHGIAIDNNTNNNIHINQIHNINHFKRVLKKHFLQKYSSDL